MNHPYYKSNRGIHVDRECHCEKRSDEAISSIVQKIKEIATLPELVLSKVEGVARNDKRNSRLPYMGFLLLLLFFIPVSLNCCKKEITERKSSEEMKGSNEKEEMAVKVFFLNGSQLAYEERTILFSRGMSSSKISNTLEELIKGPKKEPFQPALPKKTKLLNVFIDEEGITYVNFSKNIIVNHPGGIFGELITIYSIVRTLTENFEEVQAVQILIEGKEVNTLLGHVDTSRPFKLKNFSETSLNQ